MNATLASLVLLSAVSIAQPGAAPTEPAAVRKNAAQILSVLPANTLVAATVRNLGEFDGKLTKLMGQLGLPVSPYTLCKGALEIVTGLDDTGSAAVALLVPEPGTPIVQGLVMVLPTADRAALLSFLDPEPLEYGYAKVTMRGRDTYVGTKGRFSVFGPRLDTVRFVVNAKTRLHDRLSAHQLKHLAANDASMWCNTAALSSSLLNERFEPWLAWLRRAIGAGTETLKPYDSVQGCLRVEPNRLAVEIIVERTDDDRAAVTRETASSLLTGLPDEPFVFALGLTGGPDGARIRKTTGFLISMLTSTGVIEPVRSAELREAYISIAARITDASSSLSILPEGPNGRIRATKVLTARGGGDELRNGIDAIVKVLKSGPCVDPRLDRAMEGMEYRRAAETSGNVTIDHMSVDLSNIEAVDREGLGRALGPEGLLARMGVVDGKHLVITLGGGLPRFNEVVAAVRTGQSPLAASLISTRPAGRVVDKHSVEAYFFPDRCARLVNLVSEAIEMPVNLPEMSEPGEPVSLTMYSVGARATQVDISIPADLIVAVKDTMMRRLADQMETKWERSPSP